jgi:hypothetical protein
MGLGLLYGIFARFVFVREGQPPSALTAVFAGVSICFLLLVPLALGALTASFVSPTSSWRWLRFAFLPLLPALLLIAVTSALAWEGLICIALAAPIFLFMAVFGGASSEGWRVQREVDPPGQRVRSPVAWMAGRRETD